MSTYALVTQPMLQRRPNCMELRLMDSYSIQILCRFQKCKQKVPLPSLKNPLGVKGLFLVQGSDSGGTFRLLFWNLHKI